MPTAKRANQGKVPLSRIFWFDHGLEALARHAEHGEIKYPDVEDMPNWRHGGKPDTEYLDAIARHLKALVNGEYYDVELGTPHAAAIAWNALALITCNHRGDPSIDPGFDLEGFIDAYAEGLS